MYNKLITENKNSHYLTRQIPTLMWLVRFNASFDPQWVPYRALNNLNRSDLPQNKSIAAIIVLLNYPWSPISQRIEFARFALEVSYTELLLLCAELGLVAGCNYISTLVDINQLRAMLSVYNCQPLRNAAANGHGSVVAWIRSTSTDTAFTTMLETADYNAVSNAAAGGHLAVLQQIRSYVSKDFFRTMLTVCYSQPIVLAACSGSIPLVEFIQQELGQELFASILVANKNQIFRILAEHGKLPMLQWIKSQVSEQVFAEMVCAEDYQALKNAVRTERDDVVAWLKPFVPADVFKRVITDDMGEVDLKTPEILDIGIPDLEADTIYESRPSQGGIFDRPALNPAAKGQFTEPSP